MRKLVPIFLQATLLLVVSAFYAVKSIRQGTQTVGSEKSLNRRFYLSATRCNLVFRMSS